ncbi:protein-tyrosine-phosphatase [Phytohabitans flavus]|uniref:protein-tyrosine-phosphatase n=1 Tax=Phytohabitans flavus TaxID=1076124 RepID=A0A6F8Y0J8_9ACTN|nr:phosphotyrosine protein phosphatase [Phytohabitans flavus]BCB79498.1 protein-tyrosine-phosphatase [Phytohabitans flavus]
MPPFTVLHVCMGNICRSPMAERMLDRAVRERLAKVGTTPPAEELLHSHSAGTGGWHAGEEMNPPAARQVRARGGDPNGFVARKLRSDLIDAADLVLTATADQQEYVVALRPDAAARTFVLGEFGRLLNAVDLSTLPSSGTTPDDVYSRGVALVDAVNTLRGNAPPVAADDLDDPWGRGDQAFTRVADEIEDTVDPLARALFPLA